MATRPAVVGLVLGLAAGAAAQDQPAGQVWVVKRSWVRVRRKPSPFSKLVGRVKRGVQVQVVGAGPRKRWLKCAGVVAAEGGKTRVVPFKGGSPGWAPRLSMRPLKEMAHLTRVARLSMADVSVMRVDVMAAIRGLKAGVQDMLASEKLDPKLAAWIAAPKFTPEDFERFVAQRRPESAARDLQVKDEEKGLLDINSEAFEEAGRLAAAAMAQDLGDRIVTDERLNRYVNLVAALVGQVSSRYDLVYHVVIVDDARVNSYSVAGGYIAVTTGLLTLCQDESELAAALAHEIAHIARDHGMKERRNVWKEVGVDPALEAELERVLKQKGEDVSAFHTQAARELSRMLSFFRSVSYSKKRIAKQEREADFYGLVYLIRAGYDPDALRRLVDRIGRRYGYENDGQMVVHDAPRLRLAYIRAYAEYCHARALPNRAFKEEFQREIERLAEGNMPGVRPPVRRKTRPAGKSATGAPGFKDPFAELDRVFGR